MALLFLFTPHYNWEGDCQKWENKDFWWYHQKEDFESLIMECLKKVLDGEIPGVSCLIRRDEHIRLPPEYLFSLTITFIA